MSHLVLRHQLGAAIRRRVSAAAGAHRLRDASNGPRDAAAGPAPRVTTPAERRALRENLLQSASDRTRAFLAGVKPEGGAA